MMKWSDILDVGLGVANLAVNVDNASKLQSLQMQNAALSLIQVVIKQLRDQIFNYKQTAETILENESRMPLASAGAMKILEERLQASNITPELFQELSDKEYAASTIKLIRENSNRMFNQLSDTERAKVLEVTSATSRLRDYNFYIENYESAKKLQQATKTVNVYQGRNGSLAMIGIGLYISIGAGILYVSLMSITDPLLQESGWIFINIIEFAVWLWGFTAILKWKNGHGFKDAKEYVEQHKDTVDLKYFKKLEKELGDVEQVKILQSETQNIVARFFQDSPVLSA